MWMARLSPLLLAIIVIPTVGAVVDLGGCYVDQTTSVSPSDPKLFYGGLNPFYSINKGIADGIQKTMDNQTLQDIYDYIENVSGHKSLGTIINDIIKEQAGAIAFFCAGLLIILVALILGVTICSCRCCCNACGADKKETTYPSLINVLLLLFGLIASFAFILTGLIIFNLSANNLYFAIDRSPIWINAVVNDIDNVVLYGANETQCTVQTSVDETFSSLEQQMTAFPSTLLNQLLDDSGVNALNQFDYDGLNALIATANDLNQKILDETGENSACSTRVHRKLTDLELNAVLQVVQVATGYVQSVATQAVQESTNSINQTNINGILAQVISSMTTIQDQLNNQMTNLNNQVDASMQIVRNIQNSINSAHHDIVTWSGYTAVKAGWEALVSIPSCICLLFTLLTIVGLLYWLSVGKKVTGMGYVAIFGFYVTIFLTILAMGVTSAAFVGGWAISGACKPMFEDPSFTILGLANNIGTINIIGLDGTNTTTNVQQLMLNCEKKMTVFGAINGNVLINVQMVNEVLNLAQAQQQLDNAINGAGITYTIPESVSANLTSANSALSQTLADIIALRDGSTDCTADVQQDLHNLTDTVTAINDQTNVLLSLTNTAIGNANNATNITVGIVNSQFYVATDLINSSVSTMLDGLNTDAFPCYGLYQSYENAGVLVCDWFGRPVQGMWGAAGLAALFFIPAAFLMLCASKVLFTGRRITKEQGAKYVDRQVVEPVGVHRTYATQDPWDADDDDLFRKPHIHSDTALTQPAYYQQPTASAAAPWMTNSDSKGGLRRENETGLRRADDEVVAAPHRGGLTRMDRIDDGWEVDSLDGASDAKGLRRM